MKADVRRQKNRGARYGIQRLASSVVVALFLTLLISEAGLRPVSVLAQPEATELEPADGEVVREPPDVYHLCFSEPVEVERPGWEFTVTSPDGTNMGLRVVFEPSGDCVDVYPGLPAPDNEGKWVFKWLVRSQAAGEEASGTVNVEVSKTAPTSTRAPSPGSEEADDETDGGGDTALIAIIVALATGVVVVAGVLFALRRWGERQRPSP